MENLLKAQFPGCLNRKMGNKRVIPSKLAFFFPEVTSKPKFSQEGRIRFEESRETPIRGQIIEEPKEVSIESNRTERVVKERKREKRRSRADIKKLRELRRVMRRA